MKKTTNFVLTSLFVIGIFMLTTSSCHNHPQPVAQVIHDTIYLKTFVTAMAKFLHIKHPDEPVTMERTEPIE